MEWTQLKVAEAGWDLSLSQMNLLTERVYQKATGPKTFYFPILKPILAVAAIAVLLFGLLLLWPKKPIEEQVVTLPGSSSAAKPDEYVENKPSKEEDSSKEQGTDKEETDPEKEQSSEGQKDTDNEEKLPVAGGEQEEKEEDETNKSMIHRFWETEKEMPYEEAVAIVKEKLENRPYETLTDKERMAFYQCISTTAYAKYLFKHETYLKYLEESHGKKKPYADPESPNYRTDNPWITIEFTTTKDGVGSDFQTETPLNFSDGYVLFDLFSPKIKETTEDSYSKFFYNEFLSREHSDYMEKDSYTVICQELEYGNGYGGRSFNFKDINILKEKLSKNTIQEIVRYYLSFEFVTCLNIEFEDIYNEIDTWV